MAKIHFSDKEDFEFRQLVLLIQNLLWIGLEYSYLDWSKQWKFSLIRCIYFGFLGFTRMDVFD